MPLSGRHTLHSGIDKSEAPGEKWAEVMRMRTVSFAKMEDITAEDIALIEGVESKFASDVADRVLSHLKSLETEPTPLQVDVSSTHCRRRPGPPRRTSGPARGDSQR